MDTRCGNCDLSGFSGQRFIASDYLSSWPSWHRAVPPAQKALRPIQNMEQATFFARLSGSLPGCTTKYSFRRTRSFFIFMLPYQSHSTLLTSKRTNKKPCVARQRKVEKLKRWLSRPLMPWKEPRPYGSPSHSRNKPQTQRKNRPVRYPVAIMISHTTHHNKINRGGSLHPGS